MRPSPVLYRFDLNIPHILVMHTMYVVAHTPRLFRLRQRGTFLVFHPQFSPTAKIEGDRKCCFPAAAGTCSGGVVWRGIAPPFSACFGGKAAKTGRKEDFAGAAGPRTHASERSPERVPAAGETSQRMPSTAYVLS